MEDSLIQLVSREHIEISSDVRSGKPRITDTRIAVEDIAMMHLKLGYSLVEIAGKYDLSLASVYAAMAYYFDRRDGIDRRTAEEDELVEVLKQNHSSRVEKTW
ncbi:MAG: DUF433 domain-containing protein [Nostoc sp. DedQUE12b]|uniref:DUF433 domain-containing protein n=1 Tax=Nostoc sp. DedQUE12b TaxID=3075398 RepID=UPI002AD3C7AE|nr:DUF433 domain-containing protein [Nostoc sp. DedQUE12b]MDZ8089879.1 DUF433 domain-containing protein [Nostoc sp. DedQUE12b]